MIELSNRLPNVVKEDKHLPIYIYTDKIEPGALEQAKHLARLPFAYKHVALMPDVHQGYGMPIGGVLATTKYVVPNAVGKDIGCGMSLIETDLPVDIMTPQLRQQFLDLVMNELPVGFDWHSSPVFETFMPSLDNVATDSIIAQNLKEAHLSLGTLGGGNHFCELQHNEKKNVTLMVHSGSRILGARVCDHYNKVARKLNERYFSSIPSNWDLAFLPFDSDEGQRYWQEMQFCQEFAYENRQAIMEILVRCLAEVAPAEFCVVRRYNIHHNYAAIEHHFRKNVIIHRKGATSAKNGEIGLIPGAPGKKSYIVRGKGYNQTFMSCSHGAGRRLGRKQAIRELQLDNELAQLEGVVHTIRTQEDLQEAPSAYKDIDEVMKYQQCSVDIIDTLTPLLVIKSTKK